MPRYHFQQRAGERVVEDDEGGLFADLAEARRYATVAAREILAEAIRWGGRLPPESIAILDADGREVAVVFIVEILPENIRTLLQQPALREGTP